jgi:hypothetical protein
MTVKKGPAMRRTGAPVEQFLAQIPNEQRREDARRLCAMMAEVTDEPPVMWGTTIIGLTPPTGISDRVLAVKSRVRLYG